MTVLLIVDTNATYQLIYLGLLFPANMQYLKLTTTLQIATMLDIRRAVVDNYLTDTLAHIHQGHIYHREC